MNNDLDKLFSRDGMAHPAPPMVKKQRKSNNRRRDPLNSTTYDEAAVCLGCTIDNCEGEKKCFKVRRELMKRRKADSELDAVLEDPLKGFELELSPENLNLDLDLSDFDLFDFDLSEFDF